MKITLHPMPEARPALKYLLLPSFFDCRPGNAAVLWNRIPAERQAFFNDFNKPGGTWDRVEEWMAIPLGDPRKNSFARIAITSRRSPGQFATDPMPT